MGVAIINTYLALLFLLVHFHVVPCWPDDQATFWPTDRSKHRVDGAPYDLLAAALRKV